MLVYITLVMSSLHIENGWRFAGYGSRYDYMWAASINSVLAKQLWNGSAVQALNAHVHVLQALCGSPRILSSTVVRYAQDYRPFTQVICVVFAIQVSLRRGKVEADRNKLSLISLRPKYYHIGSRCSGGYGVTCGEPGETPQSWHWSHGFFQLNGTDGHEYAFLLGREWTKTHQIRG